MPARPSNISGPADLLHVLNQSVREINIRIDGLNKSIPVHRILATNGLLNFGSIPPSQAVERLVQLRGAAQTGAASVSPQLDLGNPHLMWSASVPRSGVVAVKVLNPTAAPVTPNTVHWNVTVIQ